MDTSKPPDVDENKVAFWNPTEYIYMERGTPGLGAMDYEIGTWLRTRITVEVKGTRVVRAH